MSRDEGDGGPGTGLRDVYGILAEAPPERLLSLTLRLGESPEEALVHAVCLVLLRKEARALSKLRALEDDALACHLAEGWRAGEREPEPGGFEEHCGRFEALTGESLASLARVFRVLTQQRLCDPLVRNLAYKRAIASDCQRTSTYDEACYDRFREEAKDVCGPEFAEWMRSRGEPWSASGSLDEGMSTLQVGGPRTQAPSTRCLPSPLQDCPSALSFPSHLEISIPPTISFQGDRSPSGAPGSDDSAKETPELPPSFRSRPEATGSPRRGAEKDSGPDETASEPTPPRTNRPTAPEVGSSAEESVRTHDGEDAGEDEDDDVFYAFVVLHAPEDADAAETARDKLEAVCGCAGATFGGDFAVPGRSALRCVEDAINNSAFTVLLLTRNFNTRMLNVKTNAALMNSINNEHKYNTVIPLLPSENRMPRQSVPLVLQTLVPLDESRNFERKAQQSLSRRKIETQRRIWTAERRSLTRSPGIQQSGAGGASRAAPSPNIHIENAQYIMIGDNSRMIVDLGEGAAQEKPT